MFEFRKNKRGIVLFMVLGMLLIVVALAGVILNIVSSQSRLTHHQASRIQAYYASQAGINYALEKLRLGNDPNWPTAPASAYTRTLCRTGCDVTEANLPGAIERVVITVRANGTSIDGVGRSISAQTSYTFTVTQ